MIRKFLVLLCSVGLMASFAHAGVDKAKLDGRLNNATEVIKQIMSVPDKGIPDGIMAQATCVLVVPSLKKAAFVVGADYGQGVITCRTGKGWSAPVFARVAGGSFGFQIGVQGTDLVLVAINQKGMQDLLHTKIKLGADASVAAGPVGRSTQASTDVGMSAEMLTWSRNKGVFAGVDLSGATINQNAQDTTLYYGSNVSYTDIAAGKVPVPAGAAARFVRTIAHYFHTTR